MSAHACNPSIQEGETAEFPCVESQFRLKQLTLKQTQLPNKKAYSSGPSPSQAEHLASEVLLLPHQLDTLQTILYIDPNRDPSSRLSGVSLEGPAG